MILVIIRWPLFQITSGTSVEETQKNWVNYRAELKKILFLDNILGSVEKHLSVLILLHHCL